MNYLRICSASMKILSSFTHLHVILHLYAFLSSIERKGTPFKSVGQYCFFFFIIIIKRMLLFSKDGLNWS